VLQHPWLVEKGAASDKALENEIQLRLKNFQGVNKFQRQALKLIASYMPPEHVQGLRNQFLALDKDRSGMHSKTVFARLRDCIL
jgi:calcium-dependent protein kinase